MPAIAHELDGFKFKISRGGGTASGRWLVLHAPTEAEAVAAVAAEAPTSFLSIPLESYDFTELSYETWLVGLDYNPSAFTEAPDVEPNKAGENPGPQGEQPGGGNPATGADGDAAIGRQMSWSTAGGTVHITKSLAMIDAKRSDARDPVPCVAIGWTRSGIKGADVTAPNPEFTLSLRVDEMALGYFCRLCRMTGTVNADPWEGFEGGEILFLGADGSWQDGDAGNNKPGWWNVTYRFMYSPNLYLVNANDADFLTVGDMTFDEKQGWDLLDVIYSEEAVAIGDPIPNDDIVMIQVPEYAYLHRVYFRSNFDLLGLEGAMLLVPFPPP